MVSMGGRVCVCGVALVLCTLFYIAKRFKLQLIHFFIRYSLIK